MPMATISAQVFDASGYVEFSLLPDVTDGEVRRRVNRVATLDGGAVTNDGGFADADRIIDLRWQPTGVDFEANVERMLRSYGTVNVSTRAGVFSAAPESYLPRDGESSLRLLVIEKLSA